ncbi:adenylate/guanylate cyclase domain-containing protein [Micromonospora coxensis]|uniref:AAA ATPase domain-containing protein n=1 Tax=Micromonospora coxensis TaxID=356852 RepID=A0A1C5H8I5_9ACTN|nr:adenylate/guanylate cyclase domain-containing protein [Micromonospora coxensis]SCG42346.1 AAA ATPase domain-containing protein [Micromonospora coxensis]
MPLSTIVTGREDVTGPAWPVPEERRTVTVLFADIVGSTSLTERLDPEDVRALQRAYFDTVAGVLRRWHGVVEKYVGDAVMALFGARRSDGLDAYRAVRAGLEIQRALDRRPMPGGVRLRVRVGIATGEAVVDLAAARDGGHFAASGAVTSTAARLQEHATAGGVVVCAATHRATAGLVDQHALAPAALAGKALPVDVWRVTAATRPRPARHEGPLVGRRRELATARDQLVRAARERRPRWVSLVGPDGIGRSRLLHELRRTVRQVDGTPVRWGVTRCPPYPDGVLAPLADLVRDLAEVGTTDPDPLVRRRLTALVEGLVPPARSAPTVAALAALLARPDDPVSAARGAAACRQVLLACAARQPLVVAVDDLDRAAPELGRFLHTLFAAATLRGLPLAVVATHRPHWADLLPGPADRCRVALSPLGTVDSGRLLRRMLTRAGRPAALAARLLPLVAGIPGYAAAYVADAGRGEGARPAGPPDPAARPSGSAARAEPALPEAVRRVADARLDRLDGAGRAVLMAGATLGAPFTPTTVDGLLDWPSGRAAAALRRLAGEGLLRRAPGGRYAIVDPALCRAAYDRLPRAVRAEFTRRARAGGAPIVVARDDRAPATGAAQDVLPDPGLRPEGPVRRPVVSVTATADARRPGGPAGHAGTVSRAGAALTPVSTMAGRTTTGPDEPSGQPHPPRSPGSAPAVVALPPMPAIVASSPTLAIVASSPTLATVALAPAPAAPVVVALPRSPAAPDAVLAPAPAAAVLPPVSLAAGRAGARPASTGPVATVRGGTGDRAWRAAVNGDDRPPGPGSGRPRRQSDAGGVPAGSRPNARPALTVVGTGHPAPQPWATATHARAA